MFLLDTNILSAMMEPVVPTEVQEWVGGTPLRFLHTATICEAEILAGIAVLPDGRRRRDLDVAARRVFAGGLAHKIWSFDRDAAAAFAEIVATSNRWSRRATPDRMIAAIALSRDAAVVTRNVADFQDCGITVINPWDGV